MPDERMPRDGHVALGPGREFDLVRRLEARWGDVARGLGDDCAVLDVPVGERLIATTDTSLEHVHFRREWLAPAEIGWRAAAAAVSDLAAAAATPLGLLFSLTIPDGWREDVEAVADGVGALAREAGIPIVGGDLTRGAVLVLGLTALGSARAPLGRSTARPGDQVAVTGLLGAPALALRAWLAGGEPAAAWRERFVRPVPRLAEARWLAARGARAAVDVSDGLASDLAHMAHASGTRIVVEAGRVPTVPDADWRTALASGEEYEVAFAIPADVPFNALADEFQHEFGLPLSRVGHVEAGEPGVEVRADGARVDLPSGHDHFSE